MRTELEIIADLWADQIMNGSWDNGEAMHNIFGSVLRAAASKPTEQQIATFKQTLVEECLKLGDHINLGVDYHPDQELSTACEKAGISINLLPVKSTTWASPGKVQYKFGYGAKIQSL